MTDLSNAGNDPKRSGDAAYFQSDAAATSSDMAESPSPSPSSAFESYSAGANSGADAAYADEQSNDVTKFSSTDGMTEKTAVILMVVLLVLAVIASIVMLFASSAGWMKVAVLLALWSAVIGAVLVTRYRKTIALERKRLETIEELHKVELDRELATHREQELILEQNYLDSLEGNNDDNIAALRAEVFALRAQLAEFMGEDFDDEQVALRAQAERLRELDSPQQASPMKNPTGHDRPTPRATSHRAEMTANGTVGAHTQHGGTGSASPVEDAEATDMRRTFSPSGQPVDVPEVADSKDDETVSKEKFSTNSFRAINWQETPAEDAAEEDSQGGAHEAHGARHPFAAPESDAASDSPTRQLQTIRDEDLAKEPAQAPEQEPASHGRRRAEDNKGSLTVAELMAQMRKKREQREDEEA
ncbi:MULTISPECIES: DUF6779 domain-containing protein [Corynebacterium]|uniref:DUF6779 domain-containing protein n=1 Tax=Corynebacterium amycolatum TaxID=43765 RepID=A0AB38XV44_CORAY|nr:MULTISPECIES: DUF6779 domain-containing protein [Corynebacterium]AIN81697.1 hypothetical protein DR71_800 [Corynebacterium sp. ATCC 6931]KAA9289225.1 hypothetical protein F6I11_04445 [Corynebacterium amycolatum]MBC6725648.1 hypothetical protein [Corynebacterium amycolatum]MBC6759348.1 hypothetical protein [Corynebacterium sp. LK24]MCG7245475.1 hypothetical protein [Corynebacterium sp. ACRPX]